jgi:hypothetical protein
MRAVGYHRVDCYYIFLAQTPAKAKNRATPRPTVNIQAAQPDLTGFRGQKHP